MTRNHTGSRLLLASSPFLLAANLRCPDEPSRFAQRSGRRHPRPRRPDPGQVDQLVDLNKKVDALSSFLQSGNMTVKVKSDKTEKQ